jgi:ankyrin repeat protein
VLLSCVCWFVVVQGQTALAWATYYNKLSVVEILLQAGADVNDRDRVVCDGDVWDTTQMDMQYSLCRHTSLHFSSLQLVFMCSVLFCSCAGISCPCSCSCSSYVNVSSAYHVIIYQGRTPLHFACDDGYTDIALLLLSYGVDATIKDDVRPTTQFDLYALQITLISGLRCLGWETCFKILE